MLLGVVSDTHGYMDPRVAPLLQGADHILHAGDIGTGDIIGQLGLIAPVTAVRGNNDRDPPESLYPEEASLELEGCRILLTHQVKVPKDAQSRLLKPYREAGRHIVISGHSHIALQREVGDILFFNPGAAGKRRFNVVPSIGLLELKGGRVYGKIVPL